MAALNSGYHVAFLFGAIFAAAAGMLGGLLLRPGQPGGAGCARARTDLRHSIDARQRDKAASENY